MTDKVKDFVIKGIVRGITLVTMWLANCVLGWKILERSSVWAVFAVITMVVFCGLITFAVTNTVVATSTKKK